MINQFGWVVLNIHSADLRDIGTWECVATNSAGEARVSSQLNVIGSEGLNLDPQSEARFVLN